jgi:septal ring factor EnvC (AmiA/AmiB activator)
MSTMAKVFVVINLLLGVAFVTVTCVVFAQQQNYKALADSKAKELESVHSDAKLKIEDANARIDDARNQIRDLNSTVKNKDVEIANLRSNVATLDTTVKKGEKDLLDLKSNLDKLTTSYQSLITDKEAIQSQLAKEQDLRSDAEKRLALAEDELVKFRRENDKLASEVDGLNTTIASLENKIGNLDGIVAYYRERYPSDVPSEEKAVPPPIRAKVEGVDEELGIVMLSVGAEHNVQIGYTFHVYREGSYIGEVQVDRVYPVKSAARIKRDMTPGRIQMGDGATTRLGTL